MALKAGTSSGYSDSMAEAMEEAFLAAWPTLMGDAPRPDAAAPEIKLLFIAIAQGVVRHLKDNPTSFRVEAWVGGSIGDVDGEVDEITTTGTLY